MKTLMDLYDQVLSLEFTKKKLVSREEYLNMLCLNWSIRHPDPMTLFSQLSDDQLALYLIDEATDHESGACDLEFTEVRDAFARLRVRFFF